MNESNETKVMIQHERVVLFFPHFSFFLSFSLPLSCLVPTTIGWVEKKRQNVRGERVKNGIEKKSKWINEWEWMMRKERKKEKKKEGKKKCRESILIGMDERKSKFFVSYCLHCWWWCFLVFLFLPNCLPSFLLSLPFFFFLSFSLSVFILLCVYLLCSYDVTLANSS